MALNNNQLAAFEGVPSSNRAWETKRASIVATLNQFADGPNLQVLDVAIDRSEIRAMLAFNTPTLVRSPGQAVRLAGPILAGLRYRAEWMSKTPVSWEIVTLLQPADIYHPNVNHGGGLCLGHPPANFPVDWVLHVTWAALVVNMRIVTTTDWRVFQPEAAAYLRSHRDEFPITRRGLTEPPTENEKGIVAW